MRLQEGQRPRRCLLTCHFGDALQTRDRQGHHESQASADHQQAVADQQAGHRQPLVPCRDRQGELRPSGPVVLSGTSTGLAPDSSCQQQASQGAASLELYPWPAACTSINWMRKTRPWEACPGIAP